MSDDVHPDSHYAEWLRKRGITPVRFSIPWKSIPADHPDPPAARATDPASSHEAAAHIDASGLRSEQQRITLDAVHKHGALTSRHLSQRSGLCRYMLARRLPELEAKGLVRRGPMVSEPSGRKAVTWWAVR